MYSYVRVMCPCRYAVSLHTCCPPLRVHAGVFTLGDARVFSGLTSKIPPLGSMLNFDADVSKLTVRHECEIRLCCVPAGVRVRRVAPVHAHVRRQHVSLRMRRVDAARASRLRGNDNRKHQPRGQKPTPTEGKGQQESGHNEPVSQDQSTTVIFSDVVLWS